jgi:hypothetical protein
MMPQLQPVDSDAIMAMGYDAMEQVLYIQFRKTKRVYSYRGVNQQAFESLSNAKSLGQHFSKNILPHHTGLKE